MLTRSLQFLAIILTALALVPAGAHLFELPNKIGLSQSDYFTVRGIYRGWALFGIVLVGAIIAILLLSLRLRGQGMAFVLVTATLAIFFIWQQPANVATQFWTSAPDNWQTLRTQWEYAHATSAVLTFIALCCLVLSTQLARR